MFTRFLAALVLPLLVAPAIAQQTSGLNTMEDVSAFMETYYLHPRPDRIGDLIDVLSPSGFVQKRTNGSVVVAFFSEIFAANPSRVAEWQERIAKQNDRIKYLLERALAVSRTGGVLRGSSHSPEANDAYWAAFFASGKPEFIYRLVDQLRYFDERNDLVLFFAGATAKWSLASNAQKYPAVRSAIENARPTADKRTQGLIDELAKEDPATVKQEIGQIIQAQRQAGKWK